MSTFPTVELLEDLSKTTSMGVRFLVGVYPTLVSSIDVIFIDRVIALLAIPQVSAFG